MAWSSHVMAPPLVTTTTLGSCGSVNTIWILLLQFGLGGFNKGLGAGFSIRFGVGLGTGFGTVLAGQSVLVFHQAMSCGNFSKL